MKKNLLLALSLFMTFSVCAQTAKVGTIIYENDQLKGDTPKGIVISVSSDGKSGVMLAIADKTEGEGCEWGPYPTPIEGVNYTLNREVALKETNAAKNTVCLCKNLASEEERETYAITKITSEELAEGWYIPSCGQLRAIGRMLDSLNKILEGVDGAAPIQKAVYWSATAYSEEPGEALGAWALNLAEDVPLSDNVFAEYHLRLVKPFKLK